MSSPWPHDGAFVLQLRLDADPAAGPFEGRVEHVATGAATPFRTAEELRAFLARVLADVRARDPEWPQDPPSVQRRDPAIEA